MRRLSLSREVAAARSAWRWDGRARPPFADVPVSGQVSVWDFPRPPSIEPVPAELEVRCGGRLVARTSNGMRVCETASAPAYYFPPGSVDAALATATGRQFHCEWKGISEAVQISSSGIANAGWRLTAVYPEFERLFGWTAFYPQAVDCFIDGTQVAPQPGGYYGGWVTADLAGPIKGGAGSAGW